MSKKKRARTQAVPAAPQAVPAAPQPAPPAAPNLAAALQKKLLWPVIAGILLFFLLAIQGGGDDRILAIAAAVAFVACTIGKTPFRHISERISVPVLAVACYLAFNAAASLYSRFGRSAASEFAKILTAFCVFGIVLYRLKAGRGRAAAAVLSTVTAVLALVSVDASSWGVLSNAYVGLMDRLGCSYAEMNIGYEAGIRVTGVFGNANLLAGILAFGVFLSLYLVSTASSKAELLGCCLLAEINTLGFILAFSMGAIAMFMVSVIIYLLASAKMDRLPLLVIMAETAVIGLVMTFIAFPGLGGGSCLPVLAGPLGGVLLWALHHWGGRRASCALNRRPRAVLIAIAAAVLLVVVYTVLAFQITGAYTLAAGETLRRSVYPSAGTYSLEGDWTGNVNVWVESQNSVDTIMHTSTVLYSGELSNAVFTVPEDSKVVYLNFNAPEGASLNRVALSGGEKVKLGYKLLPGFAANRLQGLWANQNAIQRTEFFRDGLRIWLKSPVFGNGLASVDGLVTSVQQFFYESKYVHNQYIQAMAEMGIFGLIVFVGMLAAAAVTLFLRRREGGGNPLLAACTACLAMMALHGAAEAVWSVGYYQTVALMLLALIAVEYAKPLKRLTGFGAAAVATLVLWAFTIIFSVLLFNHISAEREYNRIVTGLQTQTAESMTQLAQKDVYGWAQYKLDMAVNACDAPVAEYAATAAKYAAQVRKLGLYSANYSLALYHYGTLEQWDEAFAATREGILQSASRAESWQELFYLYAFIFPGEDAEDAVWFAQQSLELYEMLQEYNDGRLEQITLTEQNWTFIQRMQAIAGYN